YWAEIIEIFATKDEWRAAVTALEKYAASSAAGTAREALEKVLELPWNVKLQGFHERVPLSSLSRFCTRDWLQTRHIDLMLELLDPHGARAASGIRVLPSGHPQQLMDLYEDGGEGYDTERGFADLRELGHDFGTGADSTLLTVGNINADHWVALVIDFEAKMVHYGDAFGGRPNTLLKDAYSWWISQHHRDAFAWRDLPITTQTDSNSCGVLATNALEHYLDPKVRLLEMKDARDARLRALSDIVDRH
ncbi:hypothetical protein GGX14DRAFT_317521, partial [Mycena pura]